MFFEKEIFMENCRYKDLKFFNSTLQFCKYFWNLIDCIVLNICANLKYNR